MTVHIIHFSGPINSVTTERIRDTCLQALSQNATEIALHFASAGGSTDAGFSLYNFLRSLPIPLTIHNIGNVESIAVVVFLAGAIRNACPHSRFLIHALNWGFSAGSVDHARLREFVSTLDNDLERYVAIFDERTKDATTSIDVRMNLNGEEKIIGAVEAVSSLVAHKVADAVIDFNAINWWVSGITG